MKVNTKSKPKKKILKKKVAVEEVVVEEQEEVKHNSLDYVPRHTVGMEVKWCNDVCMNPLRYINVDCEGCQFFKKCQAICKLDFKGNYAKKRAKEDEETSILLDSPAPIKSPSKVKPAPSKPGKKETVSNKPAIKKPIDSLVDELDFSF